MGGRLANVDKKYVLMMTGPVQSRAGRGGARPPRWQCSLNELGRISSVGGVRVGWMADSLGCDKKQVCQQNADSVGIGAS